MNTTLTPAKPPAAEQQALDAFVDISPPGLASSQAGEAHSAASFSGKLFLGVVAYDPATRRDFRRILRFVSQGKGWTTLYRHSLSAAPEEPPGAAAAQPEEEGLLSEADSAVTPVPRPGRLLMRLGSPLATHTLATADGKDFLAVNTAAPETSDAFALRQFVSTRRQMYALWSFAGNTGLRTTPLTMDGDSSWRDIPLPQLPDGRAVAAGQLAVFGEDLFMSVPDATLGFELLRLSSPDESAPVWTPVISRGGQRFAPNAEVFAMVAWQDALYLATGSRAGEVKDRPWLPKGFELIRVYPDGTWDLIAGEQRPTQTGLKVPLAALAPGLDEFRPASFRCLCAHGEEMLLGTYEDVDGFRIWNSTDGENWSAVPHVELSGYSHVQAACFRPIRDGVVLELRTHDPGQGRKISLWLRQRPDRPDPAAEAPAKPRARRGGYRRKSIGR